MKANAAFLAVLFVFVSTTSCTTQNTSTGLSASAAVPNSTPDTMTGKERQPVIDTLQARVAAQGINPDSPQGRELVKFSAELARDSQARAAMGSHDSPAPSRSLSADDRLRMLHAMNGAMNATPGDCEAWHAHSTDIFALARTLSPQAFQSAIEMAELSFLQRQPVRDERYTTAELLDADARLDAVPMPEDVRDPEHMSSAQKCKVSRTVVAVVDAMPQLLQRRVTFEFLQKISHRPLAVDTVLNEPQAYLDEIFDQRQLPEAMRRQLPADGSVRLPFRRFVVDGEWISQLPGESGLIRDTYINRRNDGVIAELLTSAGRPENADWADFILTYGIEDLRRQSVSKSKVTLLATMPDERAIAEAPTHFTEGSAIYVPLPQPQPDRSAFAQQCKVGGSRPASAVFPSLSGVAVDLQCATLTRAGKIIAEDQNVWLSDYHITFNLSWNVNGQTGHLVIHNITIE